MNILTAQEVKSMMHSDPGIQLVMVLSPEAFAKAHIPHSININKIGKALRELPKNSKIIVYCSDTACLASYHAYHQLEQAGYSQIWRFAGGLREWSEAGFELVQ